VRREGTSRHTSAKAFSFPPPWPVQAITTAPAFFASRAPSSTFSELPDVEIATDHVPFVNKVFQLAGKNIFVGIIVGDGRHGGAVGGERHRGQSGTIFFEPAGQFGRQMLRVRRRPRRFQTPPTFFCFATRSTSAAAAFSIAGADSASREQVVGGFF
jgi:hypothetical protein